MLVPSGCGSTGSPVGEEAYSVIETSTTVTEPITVDSDEENNANKLQIEVNGHVLNATFADNTSARALG